MKEVTGPPRGVMTNAWAKFVYESDAARLKADCQNKYGMKPVPGKNVPYFTPKQLAEYRGISTKTLERERKGGAGPVFKKLSNKRIRYYIKDVEAWLDQQNGIAGSN